VDFETEQPPTVRHRFCAPAAGARNSLSEFAAPSLALAQFAAESLKLTCEPLIVTVRRRRVGWEPRREVELGE
jgi:hypothetical protein